MSKAKKGSKENPISSQDLANVFLKIGSKKRDYQISEAAIKDGFCNYSYEIVKGDGVGNRHNVKGKAGIIKDSLQKAFNNLTVHLAFMDDIFKHSEILVDDIEKMHNHEKTLLYTITGFKMSGDDENPSIALSGYKYVSLGVRIPIDIPKTPIDDTSSYKWWNELKTASDLVRNEVAKYHEGNYIPVEVDDEEEDDKGLKQTKMTFSVSKEKDVEFENAEV